MIRTLLRVSILAVRRDPIVLGLTFVLPIVFFTVFGLIFGRMGQGKASTIALAIVDADRTDTSARMVKAIGALDALKLVPVADRAAAEHELRQGKLAVAVIIPSGFDRAFCRKGEAQQAVELIYDSANPIARFTVEGLLHGAAARVAPERLIQRGMEQLEAFGGPITAEQKTALDALTPYARGEKPWAERPGAGQYEDACTPGSPDQQGVVAIRATDVRGEKKNMIAYYAAGVAVMFILFSMAGAGGALLGEEESGTLERILSSNATMGTLLTSYFLFFMLLGVLQVTLMFIYAAAVFGLELFTPNRIAGFILMTVATASGAAAFGLVLATICRSRAQLSGISTLVILLMSALGGSMVPRFVMPPIMNTLALFTFNGWALDGYLEVFWYDDPAAAFGASIVAALPRAGVLFGFAAVCLAAARRFARRWEST